MYAFEVSLDNRSIVSFGHEGFMILWDIESERKRLAVRLESRFITTCSYCNIDDDNTYKTLIACGGLDNTCYVYDISNIDGLQINGNVCLVASLKQHSAEISAIKPLSDFKILTASADSKCILWDIDKSQPIQLFTSDSCSDFTTMEIINTPNNAVTFMTGSVDGFVRIYDLRQKSHVLKFANGTNGNEVNIIKAFKNNTSFVTGSEDGIIRFYDFRSFQQLNYYDMDENILDSASLANINGVMHRF